MICGIYLVLLYPDLCRFRPICITPGMLMFRIDLNRCLVLGISRPVLKNVQILPESELGCEGVFFYDLIFQVLDMIITKYS